MSTLTTSTIAGLIQKLANTPPEVFNNLNREFNFVADMASAKSVLLWLILTGINLTPEGLRLSGKTVNPRIKTQNRK